MPTFFTLAEVLEMAVAIEEKGKAYYQGFAQKAPNAKLKELFRFLAEEETRHQIKFQELHQKNIVSPPPLPYDWAEVQRYLKVITDSRFFAPGERGIGKVGSGKNEEEVIRLAIGFEKETILFYSELSNLVLPEDAEVIREIIKEEKSHIQKLSEALPKNYEGEE